MSIDTSAPLASAAIPSNTLTLTNFEPSHFDNADFMNELRAKAASYGPICFFSPIRTFRRIFVVYESTFDAQRAKASLHNTLFVDSVTKTRTPLRVYFGSHTELSMDSDRYYLHLPETKATAENDPAKTGLHSPPGSPPLGHTEMDEDEEMVILELPSVPSPAIQIATPTSPVAAATAPLLVGKFSSKLRIDTTTSTQSSVMPTMCSNASQRRSPVSPSSASAGGLYPSTPTLLAFSPAQDSKGEQPFITIQDWAQCC
ncbi:hypothetical protein EMPS_01073 [Entomortierella parvispora]|uniref:Calcipressin n=1 Tax=Entomortierella parvispora TaxID=205924 RepID=A0A9P3H2A9_9FUNG|nr:hypothetical protein EMPS_01073 [Entomortierella parvispora]